MSEHPDLAALRLPSTDVLSGRTIGLELIAGGELQLAFIDERVVNWQSAGVSWTGRGTDRYDAVEVDEWTYFIDIDLRESGLQALTVVLSTQRGWALVIHQKRVPGPINSRRALPAVSQDLYPARVTGAKQSGAAPHPTRDLLGRWHMLRFGAEDLYEHISIGSETVCSYRLRAQSVPDEAESHPATFYKMSDGLYVVAWREKASQQGMVFAVNLRQLRTTGKVLHPLTADRSVSLPLGGVIVPAEVSFPAFGAFKRS